MKTYIKPLATILGLATALGSAPAWADGPSDRNQVRKERRADQRDARFERRDVRRDRREARRDRRDARLDRRERRLDRREDRARRRVIERRRAVRRERPLLTRGRIATARLGLTRPEFVQPRARAYAAQVRRMDRNNDGFISRREVRIARRRGFVVPREVRRTVRFRRGVTVAELVRERRFDLRMEFDRLDRNNDGMVTRFERRWS